MSTLTDFQQELHNKYINKPFWGIGVPPRMACYGPFKMILPSNKEVEVFYKKNEYQFVDINKTIYISLTWTNDGTNFVDPFGNNCSYKLCD